MKQLFDTVSHEMSALTTKRYSTSFSLGISFLAKDLHKPIYAVYGFVRFADEIVDSFHDFNKSELLADFTRQTYEAIEKGISLNPILNSFQWAVNKYQIPLDLIQTFLNSMEMDLDKQAYDHSKYQTYILGSAEVVGLMCLKIFVNGDIKKYEELKHSAMRLGSAFQKVNFLRDLKADFEDLSRTYFPNTDLSQLDEASKQQIIAEIEADFNAGFEGIKNLPIEAKFGVYTAYRYYKKLLKKLQKTPSLEIKNTRIRVSDYQKVQLLARCYVKYRLNII